ncbi:lipid IV(A) 3-deoxy-D-manno-octulosonic acid transferase [Ferrimonas senticii]|uniref:lipid IV(A) 3-deoxy-D-manno-octulosonic acid transferase n=1 Tax=Ferrimonas senticii TaxID=394566 RepID=UPI00040996F0|nr:lipid IV(A) 3-deoxy-D-manno-octulosonic acid transferase [Ferrimonas senticii]
MNRISYSALLLLLTPLLLVYLGFRALKSADYRGRIGERFGLGLPKIQRPIVVHCASMGETLAALPLIRALQQRYPQLPVLVTTTTPTGSAQVKQQLGDSVYHCYLPIDLSGVMRRFLQRLQPSAVILMETELWPNLVHHCYRQQIPVILANARLSQRSAKGYARVGGLVTPMLKQLSAVAVQHNQDGARFVSLGLPAGKLTECGSLKFDLKLSDHDRQQAREFAFTLWGERPVWVAGSVHPGEFAALFSAHQQLLKQQADALLVLVPRHPEQFEAAFAAACDHGFDCQRRSSGAAVDGQTQVLIGDTMGELKRLFGGATLAYVGGSLIERGGHNPLEPAAFGKPVLMGPHYFNFQQIGDALKAQQVLEVIHSNDELAQALQQLLFEPKRRQQIADAALEFVGNNQGATERQLAVIAASLDSRA